MSISKMFEKLGIYFSMPDKKRKKKEEEIKEVLKKLKNKANDLRLLMRHCENRHEKELYEIELNAVKKLIKKTKKII